MAKQNSHNDCRSDGRKLTRNRRCNGCYGCFGGRVPITCCKRHRKLDTLRGFRERTTGPLDSSRMVYCHHIFYLPSIPHLLHKVNELIGATKTRVQRTHLELLIGTKLMRHWNIVQLELESISLSDWTRYLCNLEHGLIEYNLHSLGQYLALDDSTYLM